MTDWTRILTSSPQNATAAKVVSRSRETFTPNMKPPPPTMDHWDTPPATLPLPPATASFENLIGARCGRLSVVGWMGKTSGGKKGRWLVRCSCGDYEVRGARAIRNPENAGDRCYKCHYVQRVIDGRGNSPVPHLMPKRAEA